MAAFGAPLPTGFPALVGPRPRPRRRPDGRRSRAAGGRSSAGLAACVPEEVSDRLSVLVSARGGDACASRDRSPGAPSARRPRPPRRRRRRRGAPADDEPSPLSRDPDGPPPRTGESALAADARPVRSRRCSGGVAAGLVLLNRRSNNPNTLARSFVRSLDGARRSPRRVVINPTIETVYALVRTTYSSGRRPCSPSRAVARPRDYLNIDSPERFPSAQISSTAR